jgi:hypothetical protein
MRNTHKWDLLSHTKSFNYIFIQYKFHVSFLISSKDAQNLIFNPEFHALLNGVLILSLLTVPRVDISD